MTTRRSPRHEVLEDPVTPPPVHHRLGQAVRAAAMLLAFSLGLTSAGGAVGDLKFVARAPKPDPGRPAALTVKEFGQLGTGHGAVNPQAVSGTIWADALTLTAAIDSARADEEEFDLVRLNFSGKAQFDGKHSLPLRSVAAPAGDDSAPSLYEFGPGVMQASWNGKSVPVFVEGLCVLKDQGVQELGVTFGVVAEGSCRFGARTFGVRVIDADGRLGFHSAALADAGGASCASGGADPDAVDMVLIDTTGETFKRPAVTTPLGWVALVDGKWYRVEVSPDGSNISAVEVPAKVGSLVVPHDRWSMRLVGATYGVLVQGGAKPVPVPAGSYAVQVYREYARSSGASRPAVLSVRPGLAPDECGDPVRISAGAVTRLKIGSAVTVKSTAENMDYICTFGFAVRGAGGRKATVFLPDRGAPPPPTVRVLDARGKEVYRGKMAYG